MTAPATKPGNFSRKLSTKLILGALVVLLCGCAGAAGQRAYSESELRQRCEWTGGWWHPDDLMGGFCEYQAPGLI